MMISLVALWLPILIAAVVVFLASSVIHMAIGWHNNEFSKLPDEDGIMGDDPDAEKWMAMLQSEIYSIIMEFLVTRVLRIE